MRSPRPRRTPPHGALGLTRDGPRALEHPAAPAAALASAYHRFAMVALAVQDARLARVDLELRHDAPSYTSRTLQRFHERGLPADGAVLRHRRRRVSRRSDVEGLSEHPGARRTSRSCRGPGIPVRASCRSGCRTLAARMRDEPDRRASSSRDPIDILIDAPTADVSSTAIRQRRAAGASIPGWSLPRVQQHIEQHGLYTSMTPGPARADAHADTPPAGRLHGQS